MTFSDLIGMVEDVTLPDAKRKKTLTPQSIRKMFEDRGFIYPRKNFSFQIVKGGTGKTSLSFSVAVRAFQYGARVLCIDFDQQANLTRSFNVQARDKHVWLNIFRDRSDVEKAILPLADTLHLIPSNLNNSRLDVELSGAASNLRDLVTDKLGSIRDRYDLVIMDCPPAINKINTAITCASDCVYIPVNPDPYAIDGLEFTVAELLRIRADFKVHCDYRIIWNRFDGRERLGAFYLHELANDKAYREKVLPVVVRTDTSVKNAVFDSKSVFDLPKRSVFREDIDELTREILGITAWKEKHWKGNA
jgi:chromosome partitioning protein